jgi:hypothetical protein
MSLIMKDIIEDIIRELKENHMSCSNSVFFTAVVFKLRNSATL